MIAARVSGSHQVLDEKKIAAFCWQFRGVSRVAGSQRFSSQVLFVGNG